MGDRLASVLVAVPAPPACDHDRVHYYDRKTGQDLQDPTYNRIQTCKRMITKTKNGMAEHEAARAQELIWEKDGDQIYQKALRKQRKYQEELELLRVTMKNEN